jgi:hypothetical protein
MAIETLADEDAAIRAKLIYDRIRDRIESGNIGKFVAIDLKSEAYRIDPTHIGAVVTLQSDVPDADVYTKRIGYDTAVVMGASWHRDAKDRP